MKRPSELINALKSKLHARMIQYDVYAFLDEKNVIVTHVQSIHAKCSIPFILDGTTLYYKDKKFVANTMTEAITLLTNQVRRTEVKLNKLF